MSRKVVALFIFMILALSQVSYAQSPDTSKVGVVEGYVNIPDSLTTKGDVPRVPASLYEEFQLFTEARATYLSEWHPTRHEMIVGRRAGEVEEAFIIPGYGQELVQLTHTANGDMWPCWYSSQADGIIMINLVPNEKDQYYWYDLTTSSLTLITDGTSRHKDVTLSSDGWLAYIKYRDDEFPDIRMMDPRDPTTDRCIYENDNSNWWEVVSWSPDNTMLVLRELITTKEAYLHLLNIATGTLKPIIPDSTVNIGNWVDGKYGPDGRLYVESNYNDSRQYIGQMDLDSWTFTRVTDQVPHAIGRYSISKDGLMAYTVIVNGFSQLHVVDLSTREEISLPEIPAGSYGTPKFHPVSGLLAITINQFHQPTQIYTIDLDEAVVQQWTDSEVPELANVKHGVPEMFTWTSWDSLELSGFYVLPPEGEGPFPVMIDIHGGPAGCSYPSYKGWKNILPSRLGVALMYPNIRGSSGSDSKLMEMDNGFYRDHAVYDLQTLLDWIGEQAIFDSTRVMVYGGSSAGHYVLSLAIRESDRIVGAVTKCGLTHFTTFLENTAEYRRWCRAKEYGDYRIPSMRAHQDWIAPANHANLIGVPVLFSQGAVDPRVPKVQTLQMIQAMDESGVPYWYMEWAGEGHSLSRRSDSDYLNTTVIQFIRRHLMGENDVITWEPILTEGGLSSRH